MLVGKSHLSRHPTYNPLIIPTISHVLCIFYPNRSLFISGAHGSPGLTMSAGHARSTRTGLAEIIHDFRSKQRNNHYLLVGGWATPLKNMKVSWDDDIPNIWKNIIHVPNHQPWLSIETWLWSWFSINTWGYLVFSGKWMTILVWEFFNNHGDNWWSSKELSYLSWLQLNPEMMMQTWGYPLVN